ncbi:hypothetical protein DRP07_10185 [Archaeoglobales archaeon]|nr:MAG: hypothetical protein DRP07_10185 [Archaeoglobales archaeon]
MFFRRKKKTFSEMFEEFFKSLGDLDPNGRNITFNKLIVSIGELDQQADYLCNFCGLIEKGGKMRVVTLKFELGGWRSLNYKVIACKRLYFQR